MIKYIYCISVYLSVLLLFQVEVLIGTVEEKDRGIVEVQQFITAQSGKSVLVFTDGAVHNGAVGSGACAALLLPHSTFNYITKFQVLGPLEQRWTVHHVK